MVLKIETGLVIPDNKYGPLKVIDYTGGQYVLIEFINSGYRRSVDISQLRKKRVLDHTLPTVYGVGYTGGKYPTKVNGFALRAYTAWNSMIGRVYDPVYRSKQNAYDDCTISEYFKCYDNFYEWWQQQPGNDLPDCQLDKDILVKGNKHYSEDTCCLVPQEINKLFTKRHNFRGELPIGVKYNGYNKYNSCVRFRGKDFTIGGFITPEEAFLDYKKRKEDIIKTVANEYKHLISDRVYNAMVSYQVDIDD